MPFFNHGMFVREAITSVRAQSRPVDEVVIVDDGSTDAQSREALLQLEREGATVVRQDRRGPAAARNAGIDASTGEAVVFLDSDDLLSERQVEVSLEILSQADSSVGFVYPDMQFFGNERDLVVMPPYNFYLLLHRNFCGMGSLIDRGVFEAGNRFRTELVKGHEDWDFFVSLGKRGIFGVPMHGHQLRWRRWGYSRSDSVHASKGSFLDEIQELHPDLYDNHRLIEVKRLWSPALSLVHSSERIPPVAAQSCDDFEVVGVPGDDPAPAVRGRWVLVLGEQSAELLSDPTLVERVLRLAERRSGVIGLKRSGDPIVGGWRRGADDRCAVAGVVVDAGQYARFQGITRLKGERLADLLAWLSPLDEPGEWWTVHAGTNAGKARVGRVPVALPPPIAGNGVDPRAAGGTEAFVSSKDDEQSERAAQAEAAFRHQEAVPLFIPHWGYERVPNPPRSHRDGLAALTKRAWKNWAPSRTRALRLVCDARGLAYLDTVDDDAPQDETTGWARVVGRIWVRPFPGTSTLYSNLDVRTHARTYRVSDGPPRNRYELPIGYVASEPLPGTDVLGRRLDEAVRAASTDGYPVELVVEVECGGAYLERSPVVGELPEGGRDRPSRPGIQRRWPLYEVALRGGGYVYDSSADACMGPDVARPTAAPLVVLPESRPGGGFQTLYQVRFRATGGAGYVSGAELSAEMEHLEPLRALGDISGGSGPTVPLIRLHPQAPEMAPPGEPGHRLAVDWRSVEASGYEVEGAVGFASPPDPGQAPLYRWRRPSGGDRRITLGCPPAGGRTGWIFEGTLGLARRPGTTMPGLVDLWEMKRSESVLYSASPEEEEALGFTAERVVAKIWRDGRGTLLPLRQFRPASASGRELLTISSHEGASMGPGDHRIVGFLEPAVPPRRADGGSPSSLGPAWATAVDRRDDEGNEIRGFLGRDPAPDSVAVWEGGTEPRRLHVVDEAPIRQSRLLGYAALSLVPFAEPVYVLRDQSGGREVLSSSLPGGSWQIADVRCFLPGSGSPFPESGRVIADRELVIAPGQHDGWTVLLELARRSGLTARVPEGLRARLRQWLR